MEYLPKNEKPKIGLISTISLQSGVNGKVETASKVWSHNFFIKPIIYDHFLEALQVGMLNNAFLF